MKKSLLLAAVALSAMVLATQSSYAADPIAPDSGYRPYVSVFGGAALLASDSHFYSTSSSQYGHMTHKVGYLLGGAIGVEWSNHLRTELELSHSEIANDRLFSSSSPNNFADTGKVSSTYLLGNVWYDIHNSSNFVPYLGGGLGVGWANVTTNFATFSQGAAPAFQLGVGVKFNVNEHVAIDVGYRFKDIINLNPTSDDPAFSWDDKSLASHNFQIGLTYQF